MSGKKYLLSGCVGFLGLVIGLTGVIAYQVWSHRTACNLAESLMSHRIALSQFAWKSFMRARSHVLRRDPAGFVLLETPAGHYWTPAGSEDALYVHLAEQKRKIYRSPHPGDIILDCGANIGVYSKEAVRSGASLVVAIEPSPENLECLRRNLSQEIQDGKVIVYPKGVWDKEDLLTLRVNPHNTAANSFVRTMSADEAHIDNVPLTTIDNLVAELNLTRVDFIKMDIEGAEQKALIGARGTLSKYQPRMALCTYHLASDARELPVIVQQVFAGYKMERSCIAEDGLIFPQILHVFRALR